MRFVCFVALIAASLFAGCSDEPSSTPVADGTELSGEPDALATDEDTLTNEEDRLAAEEDRLAAEEAKVEDAARQQADVEEPKTVDFGQWLAPPDGVSQRIAQVYDSVVSAANAGDAQGQVNLAIVSYQIAAESMQKDDKSAGYAFFAQSGKALRAAMDGGFKDLPASMAGAVFYNEACALAVGGKTEAATAALADAIQNGFNDLNMLEADANLASVRASEGFNAKLAEWKLVAEEKITAHALEELANGETFAFTFALKDIEGNEQSLAALKGKVVIVDVWGTWCPPCRAEIPSFIKLQDKFGEQGFQMVGLNYERGNTDEENLAAVVEYVADIGINYPCIMGDDATRAMIPNFEGFPTTLFIDRTGTVRMKAVGLHEYEYLDTIVSELLAE